MAKKKDEIQQLKAERAALVERLAFCDRQPPLIAPKPPGPDFQFIGAHLRSLRTGLAQVEAAIAELEKPTG